MDTTLSKQKQSSKTLRELFETAIQEHAAKEAIVAGPQRINYGQLGRMVSSFQKTLHEMGVKRGDTVGLLLPNCIEFVVSYIAITSMGSTVVPLNPTLTSEELAYIVTDASIQTVIGHTVLEELISRLQQKVPNIENVVIAPQLSEAKKWGKNWFSFSEGSHAGSGGEKIEFGSIREEEVAAILYTSGTTGKPKGAMLTHKNLYSNAISTYQTLEISDKDCFLVGLPLFHAFQATVGMLAPVISGCKMVIIHEFKPSTVFELIEKEKLSIFLGVPSMYLLLTRSLKEDQKPKSFFRLCVSGGAALPQSIAQEFQSRFSIPVHEGYGLTEASPVCSVNPINEPPKIGSIGCPLKGIEMKVVDEQGNEVAREVVGELAVYGDNVMKGYLGLPEETEKSIRNGWLHTGDMAKQDEEGYFYIVDRKKEMIIVAGENVYPREVEEVLYQHPDIAEAAVIGIPDKLRGEVPKAFVKLKENAKTDQKSILAFCKERLAQFKLPKTIQIIETFPKNATGKILKKELHNLS